MIHIPRLELGRGGGGWSWQHSMNKAFELVDYDKADVYLITSASMVERSEVEQAKADGKKIVLRCDNIIKNSRNRNTGMSRMKSFAELADLVIYQSGFAKQLLDGFLKPKKSVIILNSIDDSIFNTKGRVEDKQVSRFMYSQYSSDPTKNWDMAKITYQTANENLEHCHLDLVGRFDQAITEYNFDFYQDEKFKYWGQIDDKATLATIYKQNDYFLYSYFNDACSQTLIEALSCGLTPVNCYGMLYTGGAAEIMTKFENHGLDYFKLHRMKREINEALASL